MKTTEANSERPGELNLIGIFRLQFDESAVRLQNFIWEHFHTDVPYISASFMGHNLVYQFRTVHDLNWQMEAVIGLWGFFASIPEIFVWLTSINKYYFYQ